MGQGYLLDRNLVNGNEAIRSTSNINSAPATFTPVVLPAILLFTRSGAIIVNAIESDVQDLQRPCRRPQGFAKEWSHCNHFTLDRHVHRAWVMQFHTAGS